MVEPELRTLMEIEQANPGFFITQRFYAGAVQYTVFFTAPQGQRIHVHCTIKEQIQPMIDRLKLRQQPE